MKQQIQKLLPVLTLAAFAAPASLDAQQYQLDNSGAAIFGGDFKQGEASPLTEGDTRMFWYPYKAAFRAGRLVDDYDMCDPLTDLPLTTFWDAGNVGDYSFAGGKNVMASGTGSVAFGEASRSSGNWSLAIGYDNVSTNSYAASIGSRNIASSLHSLALGFSNTASGSRSIAAGSDNSTQGFGSVAAGGGNSSLSSYSVAMGFNSTAKGGSGSVAIGDNVSADGNGSVALGRQTTAIGVGAFSVGSLTSATDDYTFAQGYDTEAGEIASVALGWETVAAHGAAVAIGVLNDPLTTEFPDPMGFPNAPLFMVGNGGTSENPGRSNAFVVYGNGNVKVNGELHASVPPKGGISMGDFQ
ncbi:MAG: hypothetical protein JJU00_20455 [Opitutales bacterium]|nr:hypothetical protein [Opitutales bacterium]